MIQTKRKELEDFIHTQMAGPNALNGRYAYVGTLNGEEIEVVDVLNTTPGSIYSTAILFPKREVVEDGHSDNKQYVEKDDHEDEISSTDESNEFLEEQRAVDEEDRLSTDEEDQYAISQRFPSMIGLSCCLDGQGKIDSSKIYITVSGRYYSKVSKDDYYKIAVTTDNYHDELVAFFNRFKELLSDYFELDNTGLHIKKDFTNEYSSVKCNLREINKALCREVAATTGDDYKFKDENAQFLKSYKEVLWRNLKSIQKDGTYLTNEQRSAILERIRLVEKNETLLSFFEDASNICKPQDFGFWVARQFISTIDLSNVDFNDIPNSKKIIKSNDINPSKLVSYHIKHQKNDEVEAALSVLLQITKSRNKTDKGKRYLKVQLQNVSTPFKENGNRYFSIVTEGVNERSFFGVEIKVESEYLVPYQSQSETIEDNELKRLNYIYRSIKDYGIGHLCSVSWNSAGMNKWIKTDFLPSCETPDVEPVPRDKYAEYIDSKNGLMPPPILSDSQVLEFKWLSHFSDAKDEDIIKKLYEYTDAYKSWIETIKLKAREENANFDIAEQNIRKCEDDYQRMHCNIEQLLDGDYNTGNMRSFRIMNSAMFVQLIHSKCNIKGQTDFNYYKYASDHIFGNSPATWRPFQLAFILLNLDGLIQRPNDPNWNARNEMVDLVWFPTGGGKTEAYLGIIALAIILRRRNDATRHDDGTVAIMRYTLRLLANQQFKRAMRVIMALEQIRKWEDSNLGDIEISIGLFVGEASLPNSSKDLLNESLKWSSGESGKKRPESKIPLDRCPWCGELLEYQNIGTPSSPNIIFRCSHIDCTFRDRLPVRLCDEDIYQNPPTLLFGTVDKFAALGHKVEEDKRRDSRRLFGYRGTNNNILPPALIIQDELHLLLGPLGSAVGLFESAIDQLCSYQKILPDGTQLTVRPKIISSTATTRNTELQIRALYDRDVNIFPKNGIDYDDSFFAFYKRIKVDGATKFCAKRKYMGILPTGRTQMTTQMRLVATMFVHRALFEQKYADRLNDKDVEKAMDYYHSVIIYFNSLKEVGKTDAQFYTEFTKYTRRLFKRILRYDHALECFYCYDNSFSKAELTGRLSGSEINDAQANVEKCWNAEKRLPYKEGDIYKYGGTPPDMILATNMISVGIDVARFNTIVINSMPRNIAEYIQASSRVARENYGLVVTLHNPFRSRDMSHFERFTEFHEKLYYYVEPISITPFSKKSIEKYMPLYLATIIRHRYSKLAERKDAANISEELIDNIKQELLQYFDNRYHRTSVLGNTDIDPKRAETLRNLLSVELKKNIKTYIDKAFENWLTLRNSDPQLVYYISNYEKKQKSLYKDNRTYSENESLQWDVASSLRNVEPEAVIHIKES